MRGGLYEQLGTKHVLKEIKNIILLDVERLMAAIMFQITEIFRNLKSEELKREQQQKSFMYSVQFPCLF